MRHKNRGRACSYDRHVMGVVRSKNSLGDVRDRRDDADGHWIEAGRDEMCDETRLQEYSVLKCDACVTTRLYERR